MHADDREALVLARVALAQAQEAVRVARLAVLGVAYGADRHQDLDLCHAAEQAAHKAWLSSASLTASEVTLETAQTGYAVVSSRVRTNAERQAALLQPGGPGGADGPLGRP